MLSSKGFWHRDSKLSEVMDWSLNSGVQAVLHVLQCQQVMCHHSNDASKEERGLQKILSCLEEECMTGRIHAALEGCTLPVWIGSSHNR